MASTTSFLTLLFALVLPASAEVFDVPFLECEDATAPTTLQMECTSLLLDTCIMDRGHAYHLNATFTPAQDVQWVESHVAWKKWVEMPVYGHDRNVCQSGISCPLVQGETSTLTQPLIIHNFVMRRRYPMIWRLKDVTTDNTVMCFIIRVEIM